MRWVRSNAVATVVLFFVLSTGVGVAAQRYIITSTSQIKPSVLRQFRHAVRTTVAGTPGPTGPAGATGPQGSSGPAGQTGPEGSVHEVGGGGAYLYEMTGETVPIEGGVGKSEATCPEDENAVGGGGEITGTTSAALTTSRPAASDGGWRVEARGPGGSVTAYAICEKVQKVVDGEYPSLKATVHRRRGNPVRRALEDAKKIRRSR